MKESILITIKYYFHIMKINKLNNLNILNTIKRSIHFDKNLELEIEDKEEYNNQAILITVLASLFAAIGIEGTNIFGVIISTIIELIACAFWIAVIVVMVFKILEVRIIPIVLARLIGISLYPLMLMLFAFVPYIGTYIAIIGIILAIITVSLTIRSHTELEPGLSLALSMIGSIPFIVLNFYLSYQS